jgi:predicted Zn-dependent peptidase
MAHVILQNDPSAPVVITSVMYRCQNENPKELVSHFFEHLLFEGTNIKRGEWFKIVTGNGETNNANTEDRTYILRSIPITILN